MEFTCLARQAFDSAAFGCDFFRVTRYDYPKLARELAWLRAMPGVMADARIAASDREADLFFQRQGFRKVTVQARFVGLVDPALAAGPDPRDTAENRLSPEAVAKHVDNLRYDRFNLDAFAPKAGRDRFQAAWIGNSLASPALRKVYDGESFVSFKYDGADAVVDIVSVLVHRQGVGLSLVRRALVAAARAGCTRLCVTTEAENEPACRLYAACGLSAEAHFSRFHYASPGEASTARHA
jgi:GNAT superfamily N-acetyltransferase